MAGFKPGDVGHLAEHDRIAGELAGRLSDTQLSATFVGSAQFVEKDDDPGVFDAAKSGLIPTADEGIFQPTYIRPGSPEIDMSGKLSSLDAGALGVPVLANHGASTSYPRPDWSGPVIWVGSVLPANRKPGDLYLAVSVV